MDKLVAEMSADFDSVDEEDSVSPTQPVLLSQNMHLLQSKDDRLLLEEKQKMMATEKVDLQSLLSESSSITEEEFIDTKRPDNVSSGDVEEISEPS
jgi:hypothetical protein